MLCEFSSAKGRVVWHRNHKPLEPVEADGVSRVGMRFYKRAVQPRMNARNMQEVMRGSFACLYSFPVYTTISAFRTALARP